MLLCLGLDIFIEGFWPARDSEHIGSWIVRRETGKEYEVEVLYSECVASHTGPESCVSVRKGMGEASAGIA
jgi:hypothetical protein